MCTKALALCALLPIVAGAQPAADFDKYVAQGARDWHVPGLSVAVVKDDSVVFQKAYGVRDWNTKAPFDLHTRSAIGSTTKAMTVMALGMLIDEKKLSWDDRVIDHLPDFRLSDAYVTRDLRIRDLLTHRSGLGGSGDLLWVNPDMSEQEIVRRMRYMPFESPLRTHWSYNNIMYQVAGDVVAQASGMSWEQFITTRIFQPLGMTESIPLVAQTAGQPNVTSAHEFKNDTTRVIPFQSTDQVKAAGSVFSSISDMTRWVQFLLDSGKVNGKRLVSDSVFREIFKPEIPADRSTYPALTVSQPHFFDYGLGFFLQDYGGQMVAMHTGSINGMCALIALVPDRHLGFYILENVDHAELRHALMYKAIDEWLGTGNRDWSAELHKMFEDRTAKAVAARGKAGRDSTVPAASLPLDRYAGTYSDSVFGDVVITNDGGLHLRYFSSSAQLDHQRYDVFKASHPSKSYLDGQTVTFTPDGTGGVSALRFAGERFVKAPTPEGVAVIQKMHDRYASTWYSSLSFTELAEQQSADGKKTSETWWEEGKLPGKLRIDVGTTPTDTKPRRIIVFANDSAYVKAPGEELRRSARLNLLLVLGFDVYRQPVDRTVAELSTEGFDLSHVRMDTWKGRPAVVVGAEGKQFWIDAERQVFLRLVDGTSEDWFDDYRPLAGGWIAAEVGITDKGVMRLHEVYSNIKANVQLPDAMFDPASLR